MILSDKQAFLLKLVIAFTCGAVTVSGFAPYQLFFIPLLTLAIVFYLLVKTSSVKQSLLLGYFFGLGLFGFGVSWLHISINLFGGVSFIMAIAFTLLLILFLSLYPALVAWVTFRYRRCRTYVRLIVILPAVWTLAEWFRSWIFTGFPWLNLGYSQTDSPLAGIAPIFGVYGTSWLTAMTAGMFTLIIVGRKRDKLLAAVSLVCIWAFSLQSLEADWTRPKDKTLQVALIQGGIPQELKWLPEQRQKTIDLYLDLTEPYWGHDLILWPETALPLFYHEATPILKTIRQRSARSGSALISGLAWKDPETPHYFNSLIRFGETDQFYHKQHLVPFGEYLPFDSVLRPILSFLHIPMSSFSAGEQEQPILIAAGEVLGVSICYEDVFGELTIKALPQASLLINVSNDAWFGDSIAAHQHLQMARMRSIETGRYMLRATNTGISALIDEKGKIISRSPQHRTDVLAGQVIPYEGMTPYSKSGNVFIVGLMFALLGLSMSRQHPDKKKKKPA